MLKMMNFEFKMMDFAFQMMSFVLQMQWQFLLAGSPESRGSLGEICYKNDEFCI